MHYNLKKSLQEGDKKIGVWGTGYIGFSSMANFAVGGVKTIGTDVSKEIVDKINNGEVPISNLEYWLGFDVKPLVESELIKATTDWKELISNDVAAHLIAIPTEKDGKPWDVALIDVINKITDLKELDMKSSPLIIIESTLTPNRTDDVVIPILEEKGLEVGKDILVGVAPRRDWFISPEKNLKTLPRVIGGTTPETTELMREVLSIVCDNLVPAPDHRHAEMVKSIENAYRHMEITLANQLSLAYPGINMREVLRLVGTKWNIGTYHPSFGTGGYCIPLASQYVLLGARHPERLTLLHSTINTDQSLPYIVADSIVKRGAKKVGILGLAYKGDLKVHTLSPTIKLVERLKEKGVDVKVNDPYYSYEEIHRIVSVGSFDFPSGLKEFDTILIVADHREYRSIPDKDITDNLKNCRLILDNVDIWGDIEFGHHIEYHVAGDKGWLTEK